jgi:uncharacterized RDD family membrane protein YckC
MFGQSLAFALLWQKLRAIEKNTKRPDTQKPTPRLAERNSEAAPRFILYAVAIVLMAIFAAFLAALLLARFSLALILAISFYALVRFVCFKKTE